MAHCLSIHALDQHFATLQTADAQPGAISVRTTVSDDRNLTAMALTEPQAGSDLGLLRTRGEVQADGSGALDKEETKRFVKNTLSEMGDGGEFSEADFEACFREFDKDGSGTIEKEEMAIFIKKVAGL